MHYSEESDKNKINIAQFNKSLDRIVEFDTFIDKLDNKIFVPFSDSNVIVDQNTII